MLIAALSDVLIELGSVNAQLGMHIRALTSFVREDWLLLQSSLIAYQVFVLW
jgi:hypothetical protein